MYHNPHFPHVNPVVRNTLQIFCSPPTVPTSNNVDVFFLHSAIYFTPDVTSQDLSPDVKCEINKRFLLHISQNFHSEGFSFHVREE